ncbi:MAG: helix-turn-helix domain-containing protein [Candidatus Coproplasma sp.]
MTTGDKIAQERRKINLTQEQLAYKLGVTRQAVSRWEADVAYPETEKLIKLSVIFGCTVDYLLNDGAENCNRGSQCGETCNQSSAQNGGAANDRYDTQNGAADGNRGGIYGGARISNFGRVGLGIPLSEIYYEYKSERTLFGLPLVHINMGLGRTAKGFIAIGIKAQGVISMGVFSMGVLALGVFSLGILAFGAFALALLAAFGAVAAGLIAVGAVAAGFIALGAVAIGAFADGALAVGGYVAVGDHAYGLIAIGTSVAHGEYAFVLKEQTDFQTYSAEIKAAVDAAVPSAISWLGHICAAFGEFMTVG